MKRLVLMLFVVILASACDSGPSGPGVLTGTLRTAGAPLGGAVLEVVGKGVTGFSGAGSTEAFYAARDTENTYRVVLISSSPGDLQFTVSVEDKGARKPIASVVNLVSGDNLPIPATADYTVAFTK